MLLFSDVALLLVTVGLLANAMLPSPQIWALYAGELLGTAAYGFQRPARNALTPRLVGEEQLLAAIAVEDVVFSLARVAGPALAGVLIAVIGLPGAFGIDLTTLRRLAVLDLAPSVDPRSGGRPPAKPALDRQGLPIRGAPESPARHLRGRHERDDLRDAQSGLPSLRGQARRRS